MRCRVHAEPVRGCPECAIEDLRDQRDAARAELERVKAERDELWGKNRLNKNALDKALKFKRYVHERLDKAGVPTDPEAESNAAHGCRIEGRLNHVLNRADRAEADAAALRAALEEIDNLAKGPHGGFHMAAALIARAALARDGADQ